MFNKIIFVALFSLCGCASNATDMQPGKLADEFYRNYTTSEQVTQFKKYSLEEQYELFVFGNKIVHPPATYLAYPFAQRGAAIIPFLREKLEAEKERDQRKAELEQKLEEQKEENAAQEVEKAETETPDMKASEPAADSAAPESTAEQKTDQPNQNTQEKGA